LAQSPLLRQTVPICHGLLPRVLQPGTPDPAQLLLTTTQAGYLVPKQAVLLQEACANRKPASAGANHPLSGIGLSV